MVYNWPQEVKAFYMKEDETDKGYAKGVDLLAPEGYGEVVGGGERETDIERLKRKIVEHDLPMSAFEWYLDLRKFGNVPHSGFGLGLERLVAWICGLQHIREINEHSLRSFWTQINSRTFTFDGPCLGLKHEIKCTGWRKNTGLFRFGAIPIF